ncbi:MAG: flagellar basal body P-ring formation chaperone FlgA, partial [Bdellovibrionales bacterium]|nr:flagellar basal body P-ring formation chaperone FlgA [Bdellovibrionales bacterium]
VKIEALRLPPRRPEMDDARWTIDNSLVSSWKGNVTVPVKFKTAQGKEVTEWVTAQIKHLRPSAVSLKYLKHGDRITKDDFAIEMRDSSRSIDASPAPEQMIGRRLNRAIPVGQIIWAGDFEKNKLVERGQLVDLHLETEGLKIKMTGIAQDDGGLGDRVRIQNQDSKKVVSAVVVGNARVELK